MPEIDFIYTLANPKDLIEAAFLREATSRKFDHAHRFLWSTKASNLDQLGNFVTSESSRSKQRAVAWLESCIVSVELDPSGRLEGQIAGGYANVHRGLERLKDLYPEQESDERSVASVFWRSSRVGGRASFKEIVVPPWDDIKGNYSGNVRRSIDSIIPTKDYLEQGRVILFHGPPGTGKSHVVRSLSWEWRSWAKFNYILDPEAFLKDSSYMFQVIMEARGDRWSVFAIEDAGDLLTYSSAKGGLSSLLNVTDGAVGQGMKCLFLFTTNLDAAVVHPAITRAGRCAASIGFEPLGVKEANEWLGRHGADSKVDYPIALSDLYSVLRGGEPPLSRKAGGYL